MYKYLIIVSLLVLTACSSQRSDLQASILTDIEDANVSANEAIELIDSYATDANFTVLDVRTEAEYQEECLTNAINANVEGDDFQTQIAQLNKNNNYLVYCRSGRRSLEAQKIMQEEGFTNVINVESGINEVKEQGAEVIKGCYKVL